MKREHISTVGFLCILGFVLMLTGVHLGTGGFVTEAEREVTRDEVRRFFPKLKPGMTKAEVAKVIPQSERLPLRKSTSTHWTINTVPASLLATEWVVLLRFEDEEHLSDTWIGTYDEIRYAPPNSPECFGDMSVLFPK